MLVIATLALAHQLRGPIDVGEEALRQVAGMRYVDINVFVGDSNKKESYSIYPGDDDTVTINGGDDVGAMYGCFELAERIRLEGDKAFHETISGSPYLPDRGLNLFTTLPWNYAKNDTDYSVDALIDGSRWWFQNDDYWTTLLDTMAHSRLNWLDIHGMWDISSTSAPNLYAYFVTSPSFPAVGVPDRVKKKNLERLNQIVQMAHERGIRVSLMAYEANFKVPENPNPPYKGSESNLYKYTKEVVEQMIRGVPGLDAIGFRIGESGKSESFFRCYGEAVKASGRDIPLITRSWGTRRQRVLPLARASKDFTVEIKYNGEQWAAPYPVVGGRMALWNSYSFEDYLSDAGDPRKNATTWPGWPTEDGGAWPGNPYKEVWQVRANGTNRIFPSYNPDWVRRSIKSMKVGTASGYTIEGDDAYYPKSPSYYLADKRNKYCDWMHQRDEMYWMTWGRLGYDPNTPDSVFDAKVDGWFGREGKQIADIWKEASQVVPLAYMAKANGPDHRDHAPELETGGDTQAFIDGQPFDPFVFRSINESAGMAGMGVADGRVGVEQVGNRLGQITVDIRHAIGDIRESSIPAENRKRFRELKNSLGMLAALGQYYSGRFLSADQVATSETYSLRRMSDDAPNRVDPLYVQLNPFDASISNEVEPRWTGSYSRLYPFDNVLQGWSILSNSTAAEYYRPFTEKLRMHTNTFSWKSEVPLVERENLVNVHAAPFSVDSSSLRRSMWAWDLKLHWWRDNGKIVASVPVGHLTRAWLLYKPLPSPTFFHKIPMSRVGDHFEAMIPEEKWGECLAAEVESPGSTLRIPSFLGGKKPYEVVPAEDGATPQIYGNEEAMTYLDPAILTPGKYGAMLITPRASNFFRGFNRATRRKLLDPVKRGLRLYVLQQDFNPSRYPLDFLPRPLAVANNPTPGIFDGGELLGVPRVETHDIMLQRFLPSPGWDVPGNGGIAHMRYGKGDIYVVAGRLTQRMTNREAALALKALLLSAGQNKPIVIIDPGTEGALYSTAVYPDLMNALNIPFLTLGEVIAKDQGTNNLEPILGPTMDDDILGGKGRTTADAFLKASVERMSAVPTPSRSEYEAVRKDRKKELLRALGLDPMPKKTALNARSTGVIAGRGYHIEKVVFESRPRFYVTAHIYKPDRATRQRLPVIVNVNGHWAHKKDEDRVQLRCQFQALQGYIAIAIDSPGHSFEGDSLIERRSEGDHNDFALVEGGTNATGYYVWDAIRAVDYMATRPDTDMNHVGITGASGGGLATLYAFAADDRYKAAVPVVYMSSLELAPDNGCLCNHVPGTCQVGDRSDVIGIQAPKPVYIMGAQNDGEFTPEGMLLTHKKMVETWGLFGKGGDAQCQIYAGGHDYNQPMRESMIGFFNKYLKGQGDGSPVPQPALTAIDPENRTLLVLDPPASNERTMRDLSKEYLANAPANVSVNEVFRINGGLPAKTDLQYREIGEGQKRTVMFQPLPGLQIPGVLLLPEGKPTSVRIVMMDEGKTEAEQTSPPKGTEACLYLDGLGMGELSDIEMRYSVYMGVSIPFLNGWAIARAADAMSRYSNRISVLGTGAISSQAAMYAGLMNPTFSSVVGQGCLKTWSDVFNEGVSDYAVQPRAHLCGSLDHLRSLVKNGSWTF